MDLKQPLQMSNRGLLGEGMEAASLDNRAGIPFGGGMNVNCSLSGAYSSSEVLQPYEINVRLAKWNFIKVMDRLVEKEHW